MRDAYGDRDPRAEDENRREDDSRPDPVAGQLRSHVWRKVSPGGTRSLRLVARLAEAMAQRRLRRSLWSPRSISTVTSLSRRRFTPAIAPRGAKNYHRLRELRDDCEGTVVVRSRGPRGGHAIPEFTACRIHACVALNPLPVVHRVLLYIYLKPIAPPRAPYHWLLPQFLVQ